MMRAYFDDSGTHDSSRVVVIGGLCGTDDQWQAFSEEWAARLIKPLPGKPPLHMFHLSHCNAGKGEFIGYTEAEQDAVTHDFRQIVIRAGLRSAAWGIDRIAWDEVVTGIHRDRLGEPLPNCADQCMAWALSQAEDDVDAMVAVMFDRGIYSDHLKAFLERWTYPLGRPRVSSIGAGRVGLHFPLQGADIVATENYWHMAQSLKLGGDAEPRPHLRHYLKHMVHEGSIQDRFTLSAWLSSPEYEEHYRRRAGCLNQDGGD
jgi:hypothetical protein